MVEWTQCWIVFSLSFHFLTVCNPLADEMKSPGSVWGSGGGAAVGLPGWGQQWPRGEWGWEQCVQVPAAAAGLWEGVGLEDKGQTYGKRQLDCCWRPAGLREIKTGLKFNLFCELLLPSAGHRMLQPCPVKCAVLVLENFLRWKPFVTNLQWESLRNYNERTSFLFFFFEYFGFFGLFELFFEGTVHAAHVLLWPEWLLLFVNVSCARHLSQ